MSKKIEALTMPKWGIEMEEGKLTEWLIEEGSSFSKGDALLVVETDKISNVDFRDLVNNNTGKLVIIKNQETPFDETKGCSANAMYVKVSLFTFSEYGFLNLKPFDNKSTLLLA